MVSSATLAGLGGAVANFHSIDDLPGPKGWPALGNLLDFKTAPQTLEVWRLLYGDAYQIRIGTRPIVVLGDLDAMVTILRQRPDSFRRASTIESVFAEIGANGLFSAEGDRWRRQRVLTMPAFQVRHLRQFYPTMATISKRLIARWRAFAASGEDFAVRPELTRLTIDVTTNLAFGVDLSTLGERGAAIRRHLDDLLPTVASRVAAPFPYWRWLPYGGSPKFTRSLATVQQAALEFIATARRRLENDPRRREEPPNLLEAMLATDGGFTDDEVVGAVITILVAGEDTTAAAMSWMLYHLATNPRAAAAATAEVDAAVGADGILRDYAALSELPYLEAAMMETLRLRSVAPVLFVETIHDTEVAGLQLPKGTAILLMMRQAGMLEPQIGDPKSYLPERWLGHLRPPDLSHEPRAVMPFGAGPRLCPGRALAGAEIKTAVAAILKAFVLRPPANGRIPEERFDFVTVPTNLWLRLEPRWTEHAS